MTVEESIKNAKKIGDLKSIRIMMKNSLLVDPTFVEFSEMERYTRDIVDTLYVSHDNREMEIDKSKWDEDYLCLIMAQSISNFSYERVKHLKNIVNFLHPVRAGSHNKISKDVKPKNNISTSDYQKQKEQDRKAGNIINPSTKILISATVGGIVCGTVASLVGSSVISSAIIGAATAGSVATVLTVINKG